MGGCPSWHPTPTAVGDLCTVPGDDPLESRDAEWPCRAEVADVKDEVYKKSSNLGWAPGAEDVDQPDLAPQKAISRVLSSAASRALNTAENVQDGQGSPSMVSLRLQVELKKGWTDCSPESTREVCELLSQGKIVFTISTNGQEYILDFGNKDGPVQTNILNGRERRLRLIDASNVGADCVKRRTSEVQQQTEYGPQSKRGNASQRPWGKYLQQNEHAQACYSMLVEKEKELCGDWAVFYHSYSFAALLYEVQAAVGHVLFRFQSGNATLPRIFVEDFLQVPDAASLLDKFDHSFKDDRRDHNPAYRRVGISAMCSLVATAPEVCVAKIFNAGYSCKDLSFYEVLESLLKALYVPRHKVHHVALKIIALAEEHSLDVSQFGGKPCKSCKAGHLLQIFVRRDLVDRLTYAALPYGAADPTRMPMSAWMNSNSSFSIGQARLLAHPKFFMSAECVRMYTASADPSFHQSRRSFQAQLVKLIRELGEPALRQRAAAGIYGGTLPAWWSTEDPPPPKVAKGSRAVQEVGDDERGIGYSGSPECSNRVAKVLAMAASCMAVKGSKRHGKAKAAISGTCRMAKVVNCAAVAGGA